MGIVFGSASGSSKSRLKPNVAFSSGAMMVSAPAGFFRCFLVFEANLLASVIFVHAHVAYGCLVARGQVPLCRDSAAGPINLRLRFRCVNRTAHSKRFECSFSFNFL